MRKGRIIGVLTMALSLLIGMQAYAEETPANLGLSVSGPAGMTGTSAEAGDTLTFNIELSGIKGHTELDASHLRFQVATTEDVGNSAGRIGNPKMTTTLSDYMAENNAQVPGVTSLQLNANIKDLASNKAEAVVTLPITEDMADKTLYYKVDLVSTSSGELTTPVVGSFSVEPEDSDPEITLTAQVGADMSKLEKGKAFPIELTVTNPNAVALPYVHVAAGYSEAGMYDDAGNETGVEPEPLGTFTELPAGVTTPEAGEACIPSLAPGASVTLKLNAVIPENYGKESIVFSYAAVSFEDENQETPIVAAITEEKGVIAKSADAPQNPGASNSGTPAPETTNPDAGQTPSAGKTPAVKTPVPRTGDAATTAGTLAVLIALIGAAGAIAEVSRKYIRK